MSHLRTIATVIVLLVSALPAWARETALDLLDAPVAYTADFYVTSERGTYTGTVWHAPGRERRDFATSGGSQALLLRRDTDSAYLMKPSGRWYVGLALNSAVGLAGGLDGMAVNRTRVKDETVAGLRTTRYRVDAGSAKGKFNGDAWFSREGILVKAVGTLTDARGRATPVETGLSAVKLGKVEERVFELPAGWMGMDLRSVPPEQIEQAVERLRPMLER
ncbi:MAG: hypothetical protein ACM33T_17105 [Solirubrobacterales bacterium]